MAVTQTFSIVFPAAEISDSPAKWVPSLNLAFKVNGVLMLDKHAHRLASSLTQRSTVSLKAAERLQRYHRCPFQITAAIIKFQSHVLRKIDHPF